MPSSPPRSGSDNSTSASALQAHAVSRSARVRLLYSFALALLAGCSAARSPMLVRVPVVDLRTEPNTRAVPGAHDPLEETQLLYGERVRVIKKEHEWAYVEALEQPEFTHSERWQGYPGWVPASAITDADPLLPLNIVVTEKWAPLWIDSFLTTPIGWHAPLGAHLLAIDMGEALWKVELLDGSTAWMRYQDATLLAQLAGLPPSERRQRILRHASAFLGDPYYWGGRAPAPRANHGTTQEPTASGVDCSGLVNLVYRAVGMEIPRDAHEQFMRASRVEQPEPADLVFLSERGNPGRIVHVMLYAGDGEVIEGPGTGLAVRRIALAARLSRTLAELPPGSVVDGQSVFYGSYFPRAASIRQAPRPDAR